MGLLKTVGHLLLVAGLTLAAMCAALVVVNLIPNDRLLSHVRSSISEKNFLPSQLGIGQVDFWDECVGATLGLGHGADQMSIVRRSFLSPVIGNCDEFQKYARGEMWVPLRSETGEALTPPNNLGFNYWRYWHGYQILTRPLLYCVKLYRLHYVLFVLFLLSGVFFVSQVSRFSGTCTWSLVIAFFCVPLVNQIPIMTHTMIWVVAFSIGGWLLLPSASGAKARRDLYAWFLLLGMLCSFVDLFTVPLVTLTVPLLGLYWKGKFDADSPKLTVRNILTLSAIWLAGYSFCWATKWVIACMIGGAGAITDLTGIIERRIGIGSSPLGDEGQAFSVSPARSIFVNARVCWYGLMIVTGLAAARIGPLSKAILSRKNWDLRAIAVPLVLFGMPVVWLAVVEQHSIWHAWYVSRIYFSSFAIVIAFILAAGSNPKSDNTVK